MRLSLPLKEIHKKWTSDYGSTFCFKGRYLEVHHTNDDTEMATIRRSGSGWQVLIRRKNYVGPRSRTFLSRDLAESWADAVEERTKKVFPNIPITLGDAINDYKYSKAMQKIRKELRKLDQEIKKDGGVID